MCLWQSLSVSTEPLCLWLWAFSMFRDAAITWLCHVPGIYTNMISLLLLQISLTWTTWIQQHLPDATSDSTSHWYLFHLAIEPSTRIKSLVSFLLLFKRKLILWIHIRQLITLAYIMVAQMLKAHSSKHL